MGCLPVVLPIALLRSGQETVQKSNREVIMVEWTVNKYHPPHPHVRRRPLLPAPSSQSLEHRSFSRLIHGACDHSWGGARHRKRSTEDKLQSKRRRQAGRKAGTVASQFSSLPCATASTATPSTANQPVAFQPNAAFRSILRPSPGQAALQL